MSDSDIAHVGYTSDKMVQPLERTMKDRWTDGRMGRRTDRQADGRTNGRYQVHYLPASLKLRGR